MENLFSTQKLLAAVLVIAVGWYIRFLMKRRRLYKLAAQFNGPPALPFIGNILDLNIPKSEMIGALLKITSSYKSPMRVWIGPKLILHVFDPEDIRIILNSPHALEKEPFLYKLVELIAGRGIGTLPVEEWKRNRKILNPSFNQKFLDDYHSTFHHHSKKLVQDLYKKVDTGIFDATELLEKCGVESVLDALLGFTDDHSDKIATLNGWRDTLLETLIIRAVNPLYYFDRIFKLTSYGRKLQKTKVEYDQFIDTILTNWQEVTLNKLETRTISIEETDSTKPKKLVEHLLASSDGSGKFTLKELRGEVNNLLTGGFESLPTTLGYVLIMLGMHPEIQEKLYQEVAAAMGSKEQLVAEDVKNFECMDRVIKETLRIFPPGLAVARYTTDEQGTLFLQILPY